MPDQNLIGDPMTIPPAARAPITHRPLQGETDAMRVRQLLIDSYALVGREFNWETRRWEGTYWYVSDAERADRSRGAQTYIWETAEGQLVGAAIPDGPGNLALQIHPTYRALEDAILDWAEEHAAKTNDAGRCELITWAFDWDTERQERLVRRGYAPRREWSWHHRRRAVSDPVPVLPAAKGYTIRSVQNTENDVQRWVACSNLVFGHTHPPEMYRNFQLGAPSYNPDLHLVAEAPGGLFAAIVGLTVDAANRCATFEPVGTHPDHRRKGLARTVMFEGIRRLQALGTADVVYVANWGAAEAGKLYASVGLEHYATATAWLKTS
jgi:mycothiol synthase